MIYSAAVEFDGIVAFYPMVDAKDEQAVILRVQEEFAKENGKCPEPKHITISPCPKSPLMVKSPTGYTTTHGDYLVVPVSSLTPAQSDVLGKTFPWCFK